MDLYKLFNPNHFPKKVHILDSETIEFRVISDFRLPKLIADVGKSLQFYLSKLSLFWETQMSKVESRFHRFS